MSSNENMKIVKLDFPISMIVPDEVDCEFHLRDGKWTLNYRESVKEAPVKLYESIDQVTKAMAPFLDLPICEKEKDGSGIKLEVQEQEGDSVPIVIISELMIQLDYNSLAGVMDLAARLQKYMRLPTKVCPPAEINING